MKSIEYSEKDYDIIETVEMDKELEFRFVQFTTGNYGVINYNPVTKLEEVILLSPENDDELFKGLGCKSFLIFAKNTKKHIENSPIELVVKLGHDAPEEYRETITRDQAKTLYERVGICYEIMGMKVENSFVYKYGDDILTVLLCLTVLMIIIAIMHAIKIGGI
jgi:hypothetical protein